MESMTIGMNAGVGFNRVAAGLVAGLAVPFAAALPVPTSWTDVFPTEGQLWYEQPLDLTEAGGVQSNNLSVEFGAKIMDDFEVAHGAMIDEVVFYGWAYNEDRDQGWPLSLNISAFTVEIWGEENPSSDGCGFEPAVLLGSKSQWLSLMDSVPTGQVAGDGSLIERLAIKLDDAVPVSAGRRYGLKIYATVIDGEEPVGFKWAGTDNDRYGNAYDSEWFSCEPLWFYPGSPVYKDRAFELAGPGFGDVVHSQVADHGTEIYASTMNSESDPVRVYDDFVSTFDGRLEAVSVYMSSVLNFETGDSFGVAHDTERVELAVHEVIEHGDGSWEPGALVGRTTVDPQDIMHDLAFRQRVNSGGLQRRWYRVLFDMQPPVPVENGKRYAVSVAGEMVQPESRLVTAWAETVETSLQDEGLPAVAYSRDTGSYTTLNTDFAFSVHGLSTPWCGVADMAEPFGQLDLADISAFATAFLAHEPEAELTGDGIRDLEDITRFIESFLAGCPSID